MFFIFFIGGLHKIFYSLNADRSAKLADLFLIVAVTTATLANRLLIVAQALLNVAGTTAAINNCTAPHAVR
jgi:hypothetical protein